MANSIANRRKSRWRRLLLVMRSPAVRYTTAYSPERFAIKVSIDPVVHPQQDRHVLWLLQRDVALEASQRITGFITANARVVKVNSPLGITCV
jgi:hypothetical protein